MRFESTTEVAAPPAEVFDVIADFDTLLALADARGADLVRTDDGRLGPAGAAWRGTVALGGHERRVEGHVAGFDAPCGYDVAGTTEGLAFDIAIAVEGLPGGRSILSAEIVLRPETLKARMVMQTLKLARGSLDRRLAQGAAALGPRIAARARARADN